MGFLVLAILAGILAVWFYIHLKSSAFGATITVALALILTAFCCWLWDTFNYNELMTRIELYEASGGYNEYLAAEINNDILKMQTYEKQFGGFNFLPNDVLDISLINIKAPK